MASHTRRHPSGVIGRPLYTDDIVALRTDKTRLATVERTPDSFENHVPFPPGGESMFELHRGPGVDASTLRRFKKDGVPPDGTILVAWNDRSVQLILAESVILVVRALLMGDIVKRNTTDAQSGVVVSTSTRCALQPLCIVTHENSRSYKGFLPQLPGHSGKRDESFHIRPENQPPCLYDVPLSELKYADAVADLTEGDLVVYKDWIGKVRGQANLVSVRLSDNCVVEIEGEETETVDGLQDAALVGDIIRTKKGVLRNGRWIYGRYNANTVPVGTVVEVRPVQLAVDWLQKRIRSTEAEPPAELNDQEWDDPSFQIYDRTRYPGLAHSNHNNTQSTVSFSELDLQPGQPFRFRDISAACVKYPGIQRHDRSENLGYDLNVFNLLFFCTRVTVQWQDLTISTHESFDLVPDSGIDDNHAMWPGEIAHSLAMQTQSVENNIDRPEKVGVVQKVNAAERMASIAWNQDSYIEYLRSSEKDEEADAILRHRIATSPGELEDISLYDVETPGQINVRRGDIVLIDREPFNPRAGRPEDQTWLAEIVDIPLDGSLIVRLGAAKEVRDITLKREDVIVAVRSDGTDDDDDDGWDDDDDLEAELDDYIRACSEAMHTDDSEDEDDIMEDAEVRFEDENGMPLDDDDMEDDAWESVDEDGRVLDDGDNLPDAASPKAPLEEERSGAAQDDATKELKGPPSYLILEGPVSATHHFLNHSASSVAAHMKRVQKEHKILGNTANLPEGVFVRTWESRLDLLRVLLFGPAETPYANAPFIIDIYLPAAYPNEPPQVHYHSWLPESTSGSNGRLNPNLYENGTICLSLLGTWDGSKGESWNPSGSTILQVIVSILGLVLVREPYYNEAGYEALVGTEASRVPSQLYSERVFLRSRGLIITALAALAGERRHEAPGLDTMEDVLRWAFASEGADLFSAICKDIEDILRESSGTSKTNGLTVMSKGACIPLGRVLERLRQFR